MHRVVLAVALFACGSGSSSPPPDDGADDPELPGVGSGLGPAEFAAGELDAASHGGTITFEQIGAPGRYPSRRDPASGQCGAYEADGCCLDWHDVTGDSFTPWDEDLVMTLRGPIRVKQLAVYQPTSGAADWQMVSAWDDRNAVGGAGLTFDGSTTFDGSVGTECLVDVATNQAFACGAGSSPFCPASNSKGMYGWSGSKLFVMLATMPRAGTEAAGTACSQNTTGNWYDAPWIGLSHGELVRAGAFSSCQCYARSPAEWYLGDGCGQFNVFEVVNDNNAEFRNFDVFSTNFFGYAGYVGEGPCGNGCNLGSIGADVDLIKKCPHNNNGSCTNTEAAAGALARPGSGPGAALRRPSEGYRYFLILMDAESRTVQLAIVHPSQIPAAAAALLPSIPASITRASIDQMVGMRLPH